jgi:8-oxo-dGTP diphosphatase
MQTDSIEVYTVTLLKYQDFYLLLQRSMEKSFAPGMWSGVGGHVEADEYGRLRSSALREVYEETGLGPEEIEDYKLRRVVFVARLDQPLKLLLYFTGILSAMIVPSCPEGILFWKRAGEFADLAIIETSRPVLPLLAEDMETDYLGKQLVKTGMAIFDAHGRFHEVLWAEKQ